MRIKYFVSYTWHNKVATGVGRLAIYRQKYISGTDDLAAIEQVIAALPVHQADGNHIVINNWQRFEPPIRDRKISRMALAKGLR